jgi:hypothetical protein
MKRHGYKLPFRNPNSTAPSLQLAIAVAVLSATLIAILLAQPAQHSEKTLVEQVNDPPKRSESRTSFSKTESPQAQTTTVAPPVLDLENYTTPHADLPFLLDEQLAVTDSQLRDAESLIAANEFAFGLASEIPVVSRDREDLATRHAGLSVDEPLGQVLIVRGVLTVFSLGMNDLGKKLQEHGYRVRVTAAIQGTMAAEQLRDATLLQQHRLPTIIIGHSLGGDLAPRLAAVFAEKNLPVDLLIMLDSTMPSSPPSNVKRCVNLYQSNSSPEWAPLFRGSRINPQTTASELFNVDIRKLGGREKTAGIHHFNIDTNEWIHELLVGVVRLGTLPNSEQLAALLHAQGQTDYVGRSSELRAHAVQLNLSDQPYPPQPWAWPNRLPHRAKNTSSNRGPGP